MNLPRILSAVAFAAKAHGEQKRKYTGEPYITHPLAVAAMVADVTANEDVIVAAILHDVVEDTAITVPEIAAQFGWPVANLVDELTDKHPPAPGTNRAERKAKEHARLRSVSRGAKLIKLMDLRHNRSDIEKCDPPFAVVYVKETDALANDLQREFLHSSL